jgi:hypothetical protein
MKKILLTFSVLFYTTILLGQEIQFSLGPIANYAKSNINNMIIGTAEESILRIGFNGHINYLFISKNNNYRLGFGVGYQSSNISIYRGFEGSPDFQQRTDKIQLLSLSLKSMLSLNKNIYLSLDPLLDTQLNYDHQHYVDRQFGLGISTGLGKDFPINDVIKLNLEPRIWIHNLIPFQNSGTTKLLTFGLNLGLTYKL